MLGEVGERGESWGTTAMGNLGKSGVSVQWMGI